MIRKLAIMGKVRPELLYYLDMEGLSSEYGWLPSEIESEDVRVLMLYKAILKGRANYKPRPQLNRDVAQPSSRNVKRLFRKW